MGASPAFLMGCRKAGLHPGRDCDLSSIRVFGTAGSPLPAEGYRYVYEELGPDVLLINGSGGTDVCSGIVGGSPLLPVYDGEISGRLLGVATDAFDPEGKPARRRARRARDHTADAVDARRALGRHGRVALPQLVLRAVPGRLAPGRLDQVLRAAAAASSRAAPTRRSTAAACGSGRASSTASSRSCRRSLDSLVVHLEDDEGGAGRARPLRRPRRRRRARRRPGVAHRGRACARNSRRATSLT